ncbi:MAG: efflux RND transporter periplasmic adaptor subunit [Mucilaginibacter sp.]|uniref:efflux RND transporter periplasmic adaptor subunit n=1 Tax=Mucilaginibacter sp. TaxID=1882438 RepID=UPI0031AD0E70
MKTHILSGTSIFCSILVMALFSNCSPKQNKEKAQPVNKPVTETFTLSHGALNTAIKIPAELTAFREVDLYAKVNGFVKAMNVDVGSQVHAGELLVRLEAPELGSQQSGAQAKLKSLEAVYIQSNATYQRILETSKTPGTISKNDVDIALAKKNSDFSQLDAARAAYRETDNIVQYLTIRAPFDGVISARNVNLGAYVGPSGKGSELPVVTLKELKHLRLVVAVPESYKSLIKISDTVQFSVKAYPGKIFSAKITRRAGVMDTQLRAERVELDVYNDDLELSPGMVAEVSIKLSGDKNGFLAPKNAVVNSTDGVFVLEVVNGKIWRRPVVKGRETDSLTEVFGSNLKDGAIYIKHASEEMHDGASI